MIRLVTVCATALVLAAGCSKKDGEVEAGAEVDEVAPGAPAAAGGKDVNRQIAADLNAVKENLAGKKYEEAVGTLLVMQELPKNAKEQRQYELQVREAQQMLLQQAQTDPRAQQAYQTMGRMRLGR